MKPTERFDLLVTFQGHQNEIDGEEFKGIEEIALAKGIEEIELALQNQKEFFYIKESECYNVVMVELGFDPLEAAYALKKAPTTVLSKIVPVNSVVRTRTGLILEKVGDISRDKIKKGETAAVRCDLRGRRYIKSKEEIVSSVSRELIEKLEIKTDEENPDWVVQIEVVGENTGISVLKPDEIVRKI